jgi:hypothetical protein
MLLCPYTQIHTEIRRRKRNAKEFIVLGSLFNLLVKICPHNNKSTRNNRGTVGSGVFYAVHASESAVTSLEP